MDGISIPSGMKAVSPYFAVPPISSTSFRTSSDRVLEYTNLSDKQIVTSFIFITCVWSKVTDSGPVGPIARQVSEASGKAATTPGRLKPYPGCSTSPDSRTRVINGLSDATNSLPELALQICHGFSSKMVLMYSVCQRSFSRYAFLASDGRCNFLPVAFQLPAQFFPRDLFIELHTIVSGQVFNKPVIGNGFSKSFLNAIPMQFVYVPTLGSSLKQ